MKLSAAALSVILAVAALCAPASASLYASDTTPCCFAYISRPLPRTHIKEYFYTSSKCSNLAVVYSKMNLGLHESLKICYPKEPPGVCQS
ncbi:C-C motif chemokine 5 isoform X2 [Octodon degus]|uniref:C-C motif chemokine 5 isoform X2 n=1 Tax=Octodon degus TaxID=10160 RepID=A0A6P6DFS0_OCTDE|nr:C-C motif chemokine 5 isoform X2 [Octodon degus]